MNGTEESKPPAGLSAGVKIAIVAALLAAVAGAVALKGGGAKDQRDAKAKTVTVAAGAVATPGMAQPSSPSTSSTLSTTSTLSSAAATARPLPRLLDLGSTKCIPCKMMAPILEELSNEYADGFQVSFIDVWVDREASRQYNIQVIPTQIFFDTDGRELFRHEGFFDKADILAKWRELGVPLTAAATKPPATTAAPSTVSTSSTLSTTAH